MCNYVAFWFCSVLLDGLVKFLIVLLHGWCEFGKSESCPKDVGFLSRMHGLRFVCFGFLQEIENFELIFRKRHNFSK